jgi:deazaflavin-dependent oxidoreductase (nitroreductase family)
MTTASSRTLRRVGVGRRLGPLGRAYLALATTRYGRFISRHLFWKLDPVLLRLTRGRLSMALVVRTAVLETTGAKTGARRRNAVIYFHDDDDVVIAASNAGAANHPAWLHNLRANRDVLLNGAPMRATVITDDGERDRLWALADAVFPPFERYRRDAAMANRTIPLVQLQPLAS